MHTATCFKHQRAAYKKEHGATHCMNVSVVL